MTGCAHFATRTKYLGPEFTPAELACLPAPRGQLAPTATNRDVANRVIDTDEAGEDCRQHLTRVKTKIDIYHEIMDQINSGHKPKKKD